MKARFFIISLLFLPIIAWGKTSFTITPEKVIQGEPMMVQVEGVTLDQIKSFSFNGKHLQSFDYKGKPTVFIAFDLNQAPEDYMLSLTLQNDVTITKLITLHKREKIEAPLGIPDKLGGNTPQAATNLVSNLSKENALLNSLWTNPKKLWTKNFIFPLSEIYVTDEYGYSRETGQYSIAHKGTDFRASEGTKVYAMNRGVVRLSRLTTVYGNTVVVDHGQGIMTFYMHLSSRFVNEGQLVNQGDVLGLSGKTGYAESPHLHLSVRIRGVSIDPMKFMNLVK